MAPKRSRVDDELAELKAAVALLQQRVGVLEQLCADQLPSRPGPVGGSDDVCEAELIVDKRVRPSGVEYLVKWKGWGVAEATWEPLRNLQDCQRLVNLYNASIVVRDHRDV